MESRETFSCRFSCILKNFLYDNIVDKRYAVMYSFKLGLSIVKHYAKGNFG